jgi:ABC-type Zn uptake system ZnuABC Zn-binding protein ZnuA
VVSNPNLRPAVAQPLRTPRGAITFLLPLLAAPTLLLAACGDDDGGAGASGDKVQVVTTLPLFADFVREIGGERVEVTSLLPLGADPHTFEPSPRDVERIADADIAFANGLDLEPGLTEILEANLPEGVELVKAGEVAYAKSVQGELPENESPGVGRFVEFPEDPHLWMDTDTAAKYAETMMEELVAIDAASQALYQENYDRYAAALEELRDYMLQTVDGIPRGNRKLVTAHFAFEWFAVSLGFESVAVVAHSPGQEPSPQDIADLREAIERENIPAVFVEPQIDEESEILRQAADDAGVEVCTLYSDSLDDEVSTYIQMMRFNADELARCLGGSE